MKKELDEALCIKYPKIFKERYSPVNETAMCWGFDIGDGWYQIIDSLCLQIQSYINDERNYRVLTLLYNRALARAIKGDQSSLQRYYRGNRQSVDVDWINSTINNDIAKAVYRTVEPRVDQIVAMQVKEKFGGLRFYTHGGNNVTDGMIRMAESWAIHTCEQCGNAGKPRNNGWIKTLCDKHAYRNNHF